MIVKAEVTPEQFAQLAVFAASSENLLRPADGQVISFAHGELTHSIQELPFVVIRDSKIVRTSVSGVTALGHQVELEINTRHREGAKNSTETKLVMAPCGLIDRVWRIIQ